MPVPIKLQNHIIEKYNIVIFEYYYVKWIKKRLNI